MGTLARHRILVVLGVTVLIAAALSGEASAFVRSMELRWFVEGSLPDSVRLWFDSGGRLGMGIPQAQHDERSDLYLLLLGRTDIGLKLRGRALELKSRESESVITFGSRGIQGRVEMWSKWEWQHAELGADQVVAAFQGAGAKGQRVLVRKDRRQRKFRLTATEVSPVRLEERLDIGCLAEVTGLEVSGRKWWTIAVETFGTDDRRSLERCADWILADCPSDTFTKAQSYSYPEWLAKPAS